MSLAIENLIPHRAPMRWIDVLTDWTEKTARATATFNVEHFAVTGGAILETALVECLAQTAAAALSRRAQNGGPARVTNNGMLVAVSNFKIHLRPPPGKILHIEIRELKRLGPMLLISGGVSSDGQVIAAGELTLYA